MGSKKGTGTEHLVVAFIDRVLRLLDDKTARTAVIAASADWKSAFDMIDPTKTAQKFISMGIRPSIVPLLIFYMTVFLYIYSKIR